MRYEIKGVINALFPPRPCEEISLTEEEKIEDFLFVYETVVSSMPALKEYERIYGISFREKKESYLELIRSTRDDYEFFVTMMAIFQDIPSFHTDLLYPYEIQQIRCYNSRKYAVARNQISKSAYWERLLEDTRGRTEAVYTELRYTDGKHVLCDDEEWMLEEIDGFSPETYIKIQVSVFNLHYDGKNKKPYRSMMIFNDREGQAVSLKLRNKNGETLQKEVRQSLAMEEAYADQNFVKTQEQPQVCEYPNFSYIRINNMLNTYGETVKEMLESLKSENVVLDLRNNHGGNTDFAAKYIYPYLYAEKLETQSIWYMQDSQANREIRGNIFNRIFLGLRVTDDCPYIDTYSQVQKTFYTSTAKQEYVGQRGKNKNVIILIGCGTGSAADRFASDMKNANLAVLIGNNTGGEGRMASFNASCMPNSVLTFIYMPGAAKNPDGSDNSAVGTAPDIYVTDDEISQECKKWFAVNNKSK